MNYRILPQESSQGVRLMFSCLRLANALSSPRKFVLLFVGALLIVGGARTVSAASKTSSSSSSKISVTVSPGTSSLSPLKSQQFVATVQGISNTAVTWSISPGAGTISSAGLYTAPATIVSKQSVKVTATSVANSTKYASASVTLVPPLAITTTGLSGATVKAQYSATLVAAGGSSPYAWSLLSGTLPPGLSLAGSGTISGTPTTAGAYSFAVKVQDAIGNVASASYAITVANATGVTWGPSFYVSGQSGNDSWSGLLAAPNATVTDGPFKTLARAQSAMRASSTVKAATIRAGTYSFASGWSLNWLDDGELWISYPGETAVLDGGGTSGIILTTVKNLSFKGLTIQNMGPGGIYIGGSSSSLTIRWNNLNNCNQMCISGGEVTNTVIDSNTINGQSPGISAAGTATYSAIMLWYGSSDNRITHNLIKNCQGGGIDFSAGQTDQPNNNNIVDRNILRNIDTNVTDSGAIYMMDRSHSAVGNQITNNLIDGNGGTTYVTNWIKAIYLDDLMSNVLVSGNICRNCGEYAWQIHAGDHNTIVNNIFDLSSSGTLAGLYQNDTNLPADYGMLGNVVERNLVYFGSSVPASLYKVGIGSTDALPMDSNHLYFSAQNYSIPNGKGIIDLSPIYTNPQFTNPAGGDYSMPSTSPAYTWANFVPLPTDLGPVPYAP